MACECCGELSPEDRERLHLQVIREAIAAAQKDGHDLNSDPAEPGQDGADRVLQPPFPRVDRRRPRRAAR